MSKNLQQTLRNLRIKRYDEDKRFNLRIKIRSILAWVNHVKCNGFKWLETQLELYNAWVVNFYKWGEKVLHFIVGSKFYDVTREFQKRVLINTVVAFVNLEFRIQYKLIAKRLMVERKRLETFVLPFLVIAECNLSNLSDVPLSDKNSKTCPPPPVPPKRKYRKKTPISKASVLSKDDRSSTSSTVSSSSASSASKPIVENTIDVSSINEETLESLKIMDGRFLSKAGMETFGCVDKVDWVLRYTQNSDIKSSNTDSFHNLSNASLVPFDKKLGLLSPVCIVPIHSLKELMIPFSKKNISSISISWDDWWRVCINCKENDQLYHRVSLYEGRTPKTIFSLLIAKNFPFKNDLKIHTRYKFLVSINAMEMEVKTIVELINHGDINELPKLSLNYKQRYFFPLLEYMAAVVLKYFQHKFKIEDPHTLWQYVHLTAFKVIKQRDPDINSLDTLDLIRSVQKDEAYIRVRWSLGHQDQTQVSLAQRFQKKLCF